MGKDEELSRLKAENEALAKERDEALKKAEERAALLESQVSEQEERIKRQLASQRKARIIIASGRESHERCPVPVGVNGREFLIERDKEVDVPEGVLNVLNLAVANVGARKDGGEHPRTEFHKARRFAYTLLGFVNPQTGELERDHAGA